MQKVTTGARDKKNGKTHHAIISYGLSESNIYRKSKLIKMTSQKWALLPKCMWEMTENTIKGLVGEN